MKSISFLAVTMGAALVLAGCVSAPAGAAAGATAGSAVASSAPADSVAFDTFEEDPIWTAVAGSWKDGDNSTEATVFEGHATEGKFSLKADYKISNADRYATWCTEDIVVKDWTGFRSLFVDVENAGSKAVKFVAFVCSGDNWDWHETKEVTLQPGVNKNVKFDLTSVKSNLNAWKFEGGVAHPKTIQRAGFRLTSGVALGGAGTLYIDNIRLAK